jgi:hypothetical protein
VTASGKTPATSVLSQLAGLNDSSLVTLYGEQSPGCSLPPLDLPAPRSGYNEFEAAQLRSRLTRFTDEQHKHVPGPLDAAEQARDCAKTIRP